MRILYYELTASSTTRRPLCRNTGRLVSTIKEQARQTVFTALLLGDFFAAISRILAIRASGALTEMSEVLAKVGQRNNGMAGYASVVTLILGDA